MRKATVRRDRDHAAMARKLVEAVMLNGAAAATPVLIPLRRFAAEVGRSRQFLYSEMRVGRLKTILHGGRRFVHRDERDRYIAAVLAASPDYGGPSVQQQSEVAP